MQHEENLLQQCLENLELLPNIQITPKSIPNKRVDSKETGIITIHSPLKSVDYMYICTLFNQMSPAQRLKLS